MTRPKTFTIASILTAINGLLNIGGALILLPQGAAALDSVEGPGYGFTLFALILGLLGLVAAFGVWKVQKWGSILAIAIAALSGLSALPGLIFAGNTLEWRLSAWWTVLSAVALIALLLWPKPRLAPPARNV